MRHMIHDVQCGISKWGNVVGCVKIQESLFVSLVDVEGIPNFYITDHDCFSSFINEEGLYENNYISSINGVDLTSYDSIGEMNSSFGLYIQYLSCIVRMEFEDMLQYMKETKGKCIFDIHLEDRYV